ncbi:TIGR04255 family protein [Streptomyces sp. DI166]|uniref:TIGR04255 family protein n=1 Tax=Streptomyces sp. DI166 TaxID=1839783 RepID=UPI0007F35050|nr:TIGR04255 family protein [Streptomyces sp. DI166]SBT92374.1 TIGR04255 family protein [Streptomyces sp. DI166]
MTPRQLQTPFGDDPCEDVPLSRAPLVRVLAQLRFEPLAVLDSTNAASLFAAEVGNAYPYLEKGAEFNMVVGAGQVSPQMGQTQVWRFRSPDRATTVSLTNGSLSLETTSYPGNAEFCASLSTLAAALKKVAYVPAYTRLGYRYTNRLTDDAVIHDLSKFVRTEILGVSGTELGGSAVLQHSLSQAAFQIDETTGLLAQWGEMPPGGTYDPTLSAIQQRSWVLDLDSFYQASEVSSQPEYVREKAERLAMSAYRFFRWAVKDEFLAYFGGVL